MTRKTLLQKAFSSRTVIIVTSALVLVSIGGFVWWSNSKSDIPESNDYTSAIVGKITEKRTSCGREILDNDNNPKPVEGICDSGNNIVVDGLNISTGGGSNGINPPTYITDIDSLHAGDIVEVRYIHDENGRPSTDCESCYIKKEGSLQKERQNKLD